MVSKADHTGYCLLRLLSFVRILFAKKGDLLYERMFLQDIFPCLFIFVCFLLVLLIVCLSA